jgi:predicted DNA-binding transcriptional regulator AlpA
MQARRRPAKKVFRDVSMSEIPETGFLRLPQVLSVIPLGKTCWWEGVKSGRFPKPVKLSARCTAWRAEDIRELIKTLSEAESSGTVKPTNH